MRNFAIAILCCTVGCIPPAPQQIEPQSAPTTRTPAQVAQIAARILTDAGFEISVSDADAGLVTARRVRARTGNADFVKCRGAAGSLGERNMETTITVNVTTREADATRSAHVSSLVRVAYPGLTGVMATPPNEEDCASTGVIEARVLSALR